MLNKEKHHLIMTQILKDIYSNVKISSLLGFKGGTAAYLFYELPRFSVDLDFDLLDDSEEIRKVIFEELKKILSQYGTIKDEQQKFLTIFLLLSYESGEHGIKVEVNTRKTGASYEIKNYFGVPMLVSTKKSMLAAKLVALTSRKAFAARDLYDVHFFLKNNWDIDEAVLSAYEKSPLKKYLKECAQFVEDIPDNKMLTGLGELIDDSEKSFVRSELKKDTLFLLHLRGR